MQYVWYGLEINTYNILYWTTSFTTIPTTQIKIYDIMSELILFHLKKLPQQDQLVEDMHI